MIYDLIIIGAGPAGMTAGIYACRLGLKTLIITKNIGGQLAKKAVLIDNYPGFEKISGPELIKKMENHLRSQPIEIILEEATKVKKEKEIFIVRTSNKKIFKAKAVILASGSDPRPLEIPGEKEFMGKGVSYCSVCDGPIFKDKVVAVIGGGNAGFETAFFLTRIAQKIYILESTSKLGANKTNQELVEKSKKVKIITNALLKKIQGEKFVNSIIYVDKQTGKEEKLEVDGVFVEVGYQPATSYAKGLVDFNEKDEIKVEFETCQTKTPGLFAAGDLNTGPFKQIVTAAGEGAKAALAAYNYIENL